MRVSNISKMVLYYVKIHMKHIGKTIVVHNLYREIAPWFTKELKFIYMEFIFPMRKPYL